MSSIINHASNHIKQQYDVQGLVQIAFLRHDFPIKLRRLHIARKDLVRFAGLETVHIISCR
jgi:hypothetical protein